MKYLLLLISLMSASAFAVIEGHKYQFDDPEDTRRFTQLAEDLRCPKCQNQNLADSNAPVASDMREKVYELMLQGKNNDEIVGYMVDRYGDFVRYTPPFRIETLLLWFGPLLVLGLGVLLLVLVRKNQNQAPTPLTEQERARLEALKEKAK